MAFVTLANLASSALSRPGVPISALKRVGRDYSSAPRLARRMRGVGILDSGAISRVIQSAKGAKVGNFGGVMLVG